MMSGVRMLHVSKRLMKIYSNPPILTVLKYGLHMLFKFQLVSLRKSLASW